MNNNFKLKLVVIGEKQAGKSKVLKELLLNISPEAYIFLDTCCILGTLKFDRGLFYYKIIDTKLLKVSKIISNSFFPEIHAVIFVFRDSISDSLKAYNLIEQNFANFINPLCLKVLIYNPNIFSPEPCLDLASNFYYFSVRYSTYSSIFDQIIENLKKKFQTHKVLTGLTLNKHQINIENCF